MTRTITRWCLWLLCCSVVSGCSNLSELLHMPAANEADLSTQKETEQFAQGLDQYLASGDLSTLRQLSKTYPQGAWRPRAEGLIKIAERQQEQEARLKENKVKNILQNAAELKKKDQQLASCETEKAFLVKDNQMLEVTLERLKQVLIDVETRE